MESWRNLTAGIPWRAGNLESSELSELKLRQAAQAALPARRFQLMARRFFRFRRPGLIVEAVSLPVPGIAGAWKFTAVPGCATERRGRKHQDQQAGRDGVTAHGISL